MVLGARGQDPEDSGSCNEKIRAFELKKSLRRVFAEDITENVFVFGLLVAFFILSLPSETPWVARETKQTIFGKVWGTMTHRAQVSACV